MNEEKQIELEKIARQIRQDIIAMLGESKSGHPGGSLSATDLMTVLYFDVMNVDPNAVKNPDRDRFVLSKGHAAPVLYATLAERGFIKKDLLQTLRKINSPLQGHPDMKKVPGIDMSTGSLGTGFSAAVGMALAGKVDKANWDVYTLLGDGEIEEGQVWEAAMAASHYQLDHLIAFLDRNGLQIDGRCADVMSAAPEDDKFRAFGWDVQVIDGHDIKAIKEAITTAKSERNGKPKMIIMNTIKGKGVSFMENQAGWHGKAPNAEETEKALAELKGE